MNENKSIETMSFEEAMTELEQIVKRFDSGEATLESSISSYERGSELKLYCEKKLAEAQLKIEKINAKTDGSGAQIEEIKL